MSVLSYNDHLPISKLKQQKSEYEFALKCAQKGMKSRGLSKNHLKGLISAHDKAIATLEENSIQ